MLEKQLREYFPYTLQQDQLSDFECPTVQEIDVPKVLGDLFESIAGAIFVDSMSIDTVWRVFYRLMKNELGGFPSFSLILSFIN